MYHTLECVATTSVYIYYICSKLLLAHLILKSTEQSVMVVCGACANGMRRRMRTVCAKIQCAGASKKMVCASGMRQQHARSYARRQQAGLSILVGGACAVPSDCGEAT